MADIATPYKEGLHAGKQARGEVVVSVKNVSKKFCKHLKRSMAYGIVGLTKDLFGIKADSTGLRKEEFWAIDDVSFELRKGEVLGLIGLNGSGKTTLLRLLAGIFPPDKGEIMTKGKIGALIAVGAGFHPHMTGRENIYLNGSILGMSREELNSKFDDIVAFSELDEFLDAPVSTYSSGMRVKLGFSIAIHINPDILLIDEVLAVGDISFRAKCFNAIDKLLKDTAVIYVSHAMPQVSRICTSIIVMDQGRVEYQSNSVSEGIDYYHTKGKLAEMQVTGSGRARILDVKVHSENSGRNADGFSMIRYLDDVFVDISYSMDPDVPDGIVGFAVLTLDTVVVAQCFSHSCNFKVTNKGGPMKVRVKIPRLQLTSGNYTLSVGITDKNRGETYVGCWNAERFQVVGSFLNVAPFQLQGEWEYVE